ncbi:glycerophosphodiester phosphodiesterase [Cumulibacter manganitolerans]|uniref:glycerophosphodiester phosphodiesterase n=1 Tax=Cumulibacter manganitolerans TaxID=1884992 RepID=UPI001E48C03F|nr:glycerophosphodiester phosphodiesterase [Cumulibacter manganitolerans]
MDIHATPPRRRRALAVTILMATALAALLLPSAATAAPPAPKKGGETATAAPLVIGHRGASGYRPEHTLASYELAARMGADYIEPDLVSTKDGVLVARHENEISGTTNVADHPEFAARQTTKVIDGKPITGWFTEDFTLAELKTLRAKERLPKERQENTVYDGQFEVPTFQEVLQLRAALSKELGREIGVYPETKHPTYFKSVGLPLEPLVVAALEKAGLNKAKAPVFVQSFELTNLQELRTQLGLKTKTVFLTGAKGAPYDLVAAGDPRTYADLTTPTGLAGMRAFVDGLGPDKSQVIPRNADGTLSTPTSFVADAHAAGLTVHPYTFRAENTFLPLDYRNGANPYDYGRIIDEMKAYLATGIDGLFTDNPDIGVLARDQFVAGK